MTDMSHKLVQETKAAEILRDQIKASVGDDEQLIADMIQGETSIHELLAKVVEQINADGGLVKGIDEAVKKLKERQDRIEKRIGWFRTAAATAMEVAAIKKLEAPAGTITLKAVPPALVITDEAAIPSEFWRVPEPRLDKKAVLDALKDNRAIPGAELGNGGQTIQIRT